MDALVGAINGTLARLLRCWQGHHVGASIAVAAKYRWFRTGHESSEIAFARPVDATLLSEVEVEKSSCCEAENSNSGQSSRVTTLAST